MIPDHKFEPNDPADALNGRKTTRQGARLQRQESDGQPRRPSPMTSPSRGPPLGPTPSHPSRSTIRLSGRACKIYIINLRETPFRISLIWFMNAGTVFPSFRPRQFYPRVQRLLHFRRASLIQQLLDRYHSDTCESDPLTAQSYPS